MKRLIVGGLAALAATVGIGLTVPATANASARCPVNYEYDPASRMCEPIFSTPIAPCTPGVPTIEGHLACYGDGWE